MKIELLLFALAIIGMMLFAGCLWQTGRLSRKKQKALSSQVSRARPRRSIKTSPPNTASLDATTRAVNAASISILTSDGGSGGSSASGGGGGDGGGGGGDGGGG